MVRWCWVNFQCRGVLQLDYSRARAYCTCSRCGWGLFGHFYSHLSFLFSFSLSLGGGWSGGAMVLGKLPGAGASHNLGKVGQGPTALAVGAGGGCLDNLTLIYPFFPLTPSLWVTARYRLKYCLKGPLNPKQSTNQHSLWKTAGYRLKYCLKLNPKQPTSQILSRFWLVVSGLTALCDNISVYIGPSPKERRKRKKYR